MITGCLQQKNGFYYAVLYLKVNGRRRCKWVPMRLPVEGTSARKAQKAFDEIRLQYEREEEERLDREAKAKELAENTHPDALLPFTEYMEKWLQSTRSSLATATYQSYSNMIKARIRPYFAPLGLQLREVTPQHIEDFYQSILADDCTTNTVIHYHAIIRKALQTAVKKDILLKNPADKVDRPKKNVFHGSFYSEEEMLTLFDAVSGDPLELCVKIAAYYGLRRSEVLGLRWSAIDMEHKTISISHKVIEAEVDGKFVPMGEDVLKTKSSFRTLPLIPAVGIILLEEKEKQEMYRRLFKKSYCRDYLDYICVDQCGKLLRPNYVTEHFSWLIEKYGLRKVRFHDLRHICASLLQQRYLHEADSNLAGSQYLLHHSRHLCTSRLLGTGGFGKRHERYVQPPWKRGAAGINKNLQWNHHCRLCQVASIRILLLSIPRFLKRQTSVSVCSLKRRSSGVSVLRLVIQ